MIDPEVALKACQEVLLKVKLQHSPISELQQQELETQRGGGSSSLGAAWSSVAETSSIKEEDEEESGRQPAPPPSVPLPSSSTSASSKQSWLLRLFESKLFDVSMAISYLYKSKEAGVQAYIGNRLFSFTDSEVDFYLPQLLSMYVHMDTEVGQAIRPYLVCAINHS